MKENPITVSPARNLAKDRIFSHQRSNPSAQVLSPEPRESILARNHAATRLEKSFRQLNLRALQAWRPGPAADDVSLVLVEIP